MPEADSLCFTSRDRMNRLADSSCDAQIFPLDNVPSQPLCFSVIPLNPPPVRGGLLLIHYR